MGQHARSHQTAAWTADDDIDDIDNDDDRPGCADDITLGRRPDAGDDEGSTTETRTSRHSDDAWTAGTGTGIEQDRDAS